MSNFVYLKEEFVFIHMPKCGGHSLRHYVFPQDKNNRIGPIFGKIPNKYSSFETMTIIRNPYTRFASAYNMFKYGTDAHDPVFKKKKTITELLNIIENPKIKFGNLKDKTESFKHHSIPQTHEFNCYHLAKNVARFENYNEDVSKILHKLGFKNFELVQKNSSKEKPKIQIIKKDIDKFHKIYRQDFEILQYPMFSNGVVIDGDRVYEYTG